MPSNYLILCCFLLHLPSTFPSNRVFSNELAVHIRWPKNWSFSIMSSNEYSGLISFKTGWFDFLAVQGTLKSFLQHYSLKTLILWCSAFFMVKLSHLHMTTEKTIVLTIWNFVAKVMSLLSNTLYRFVIPFLPRTNHLLISWLQSPSTVILEAKKWISVTASTFSSSICHEVSKSGKLSSVHRTGKDQLSFQSQRKAVPKNAQTTAQLHSSHTLVK